jgi:tRNA pseudouridine55 synthase
MHGFVLVDKPAGETSRRTLDRIIRPLKLRGGNEGTLDPFATGLLLVAVGRATRLFDYFKDCRKEYVGTIRLGRETDTFDCEGTVVADEPVPAHLTQETVDSVIRKYTGDIDQVPPKYSAVHVNGKRAYERARAQESFTLKPRRVTVFSLQCLDRTREHITIRTTVSAGTYIRSLARDIARDLGTVGHLTSLRRMAIGPLVVDDALPPEKITRECVRPPQDIISWLPRVDVTSEQAARLRNGVAVPLGDKAADSPVIMVAGCVCVGAGRITGGRLHPEKILPS